MMVVLMQLRSNKNPNIMILVDFRLTQPSWTLWRSWSPARTTRTTCRRSSGPSTSLPSWPTKVQLNTLDSTNIKNCFINTEWNISDLPRGPIKNNSMRKLAAKTLMEILPPEIEEMVGDKNDQITCLMLNYVLIWYIILPNYLFDVELCFDLIYHITKLSFWC